jgi:hypothetical protein
VKSPDGKENWMVYHAAKHPGAGWNRDVRIQRFGWNADGSPNFGTPVPPGLALPVPSGEITATNSNVAPSSSAHRANEPGEGPAPKK